MVSEPKYSIDPKKHKPETYLGKKTTLSIVSKKLKGETGTYKFAWYKEENGRAIQVGTKATYTVPAMTESDFDVKRATDGRRYTKASYYCVISVVVKGKVIASKSTKDNGVFRIKMIEPAKVVTPPKSQTVKVGGTVIFSVKINEHVGSKVVYQWEVCAAGTSKWKKVGKKTSTLTLYNVSMKMSGNKYRCKVYNDSNKKNPDTSAEATLTVTDSPVVASNNASVSAYKVVDYGKKDTSDVDVESDMTTDDAVFYCSLGGNNGSATSNADVCSVIVEQGGVPVLDGATAYVDTKSEVIFRAVANGRDYQWEVSSDGETWTSIPSATESVYTLDKTDVSTYNGKYIRCQVDNTENNPIILLVE